jgi:hypothetical protein
LSYTKAPPRDPKQTVLGITRVSRMTGIAAETLRIWERRYGVVHPVRTPAGRPYSEDDLQKLLLIEQARCRGDRIGTLSRLSILELRRLLGHGHGLGLRPENVEDLRGAFPPSISSISCNSAKSSIGCWRSTPTLASSSTRWRCR